MATKKITELGAGTALDGTEVVAAVQSGVTKKITLGTVADKTVGTSSGNLVQLGSGSTLPAVDGSLLTGISAAGDLLASNNLSDVDNVSSARNNLGLEIGADVQAFAEALSSLSILSVGVSSGNLTVLGSGSTLPAVDGSLLTGLPGGGDLLASNNLSDLANVSSARSNLGLELGVDVQVWDAELAAFAGLTSATDKLPYFTNSGTMGVTDITSAARTVLDDADESVMRTTLGLVIGTDVQAWDGQLQQIADGITSAEISQLENIGTSIVTSAQWTFISSMSAFGSTLTDDANAAAGRVTLGVVIGTNVQAFAGALSSLSILSVGVSSGNLTVLGSGSTLPAVDGSLLTGLPGGGDLLASNNLSDLANVSSARSNLGLELGVDVQAWDAELAAFAGLTSATDKLPYFTNSGTMGVTDITSSARLLVSKSMAALTSFIVAASDETTDITSGGGKVAYRMPFLFTAIEVRASLTTAQTSAADIFTVDIHQDGTTILSTKITIDDTEKTSKTAATPPVISSASLADDAEITIDVDKVGAGSTLPQGLKVTIIGHHQ